MRVPRFLLPASLLLLLFACSSTSNDSPPGDAGKGPDGATPADGGGVCCPIAADPCGACGGGGGGWAPSEGQCLPGPCDGYLGFGTDDHGCAVITSGQSLPGTHCCGCVLPHDSGVDAPTDAPADDGG